MRQFTAKIAFAMALVAGAAFMALPANAASVDLSNLVNSDLNLYSGGSNYPYGGSLTVGGVPFQLTTCGSGCTKSQASSTDTGVILADFFANPPEITIPVNLPNVTTVYTLINTRFGLLVDHPGYGYNRGNLVFVGAGGETFTYALDEGGNIRDHYNGGSADTLSDGTVKSAYFGSDNQDRLDMQTIVLPAIFASDTLTEIDFYTNGFGVEGQPFIAAIDVSQTPLPAALPLFATGLGALGLLGWRRKRRNAAAA